jgi:acyl dehydratase
MPSVGDTARRTRLVTARDIELFTEITGDRNPLHYDESAAAASRFGGIIVQGGVTSGLLNAVVAEDLPGPGSVLLEVRWRFLAPVGPGTRSPPRSKCSRPATTSRSRGCARLSPTPTA